MLGPILLGHTRKGPVQRPATAQAERGCYPQGEATAMGPGSLLVVIGGVCEGKLEAIGLGQQQADVLVIPAGSRQILEEEQQLLGEGGETDSYREFRLQARY